MKDLEVYASSSGSSTLSCLRPVHWSTVLTLAILRSRRRPRRLRVSPVPSGLLTRKLVVNMNKVLISFIFIPLACGAVAGGAAEGAATPAAPVLCGPLPDSVPSCLGNIQLVPSEVAGKCPISKTPTQCSKFSCVASNAGWTNGTGWLDPQKVGEFFTRWAATRPQWARAVDRVRSACLAAPLPPQGTYLGCPAYDVFYCALAVLYKHAEASAWRAGAQCEQARAFVAACPICPSECFAPAIPIGSCNLCKSV